MTDTAPPTPPSLESRAQAILERSTFTTDEKEIYLLLFQELEQIHREVAEYRASVTAFEQGAEERFRAALRAEPRARLKLVPKKGEPHG